MPCYKCGGFHDPCYPCQTIVTSGCPIQLDFSCVLYHKANNEVSELDGLNLSNGSTLELVIETIDEKIKQLDVLNTSLTCLRESYVINTLQQFLVAVDTELCALKVWLGNLSADPSDPEDGQYWFNTTESELRIQLDGASYIITTTPV